MAVGETWRDPIEGIVYSGADETYGIFWSSFLWRHDSADRQGLLLSRRELRKSRSLRKLRKRWSATFHRLGHGAFDTEANAAGARVVSVAEHLGEAATCSNGGMCGERRDGQATQ
jgi:hypothetical protein